MKDLISHILLSSISAIELKQHKFIEFIRFTCSIQVGEVIKTAAFPFNCNYITISWDSLIQLRTFIDQAHLNRQNCHIILDRSLNKFEFVRFKIIREFHYEKPGRQRDKVVKSIQ